MPTSRRILPVRSAQSVKRAAGGQDRRTSAPPAAEKWPAIAAIAARQHGVASRAQLTDRGLTRHAIEAGVRSGRIHRVHRAVYAVGHPYLTAAGRWSAAVLACGPGAALGYRSAAALLALRPSSSRLVEVVTPVAQGRRHAGIAIHRHPGMLSDEITVEDGIPTTTVPRTLLDCAAFLPASAIQRMIATAEAQRAFDLHALDPLLDRHPHHRGRAALLRALDGALDLPSTRSPLEERFAALCRTARLPAPSTNAVLEGFEVDALFRDDQVVVELDGGQYHRGAVTRERDYRRAAALEAAGWRVLRFTYRQVTRDGGSEAVATLRSVLRPAGSRG